MIGFILKLGFSISKGFEIITKRIIKRSFKILQGMPQRRIEIIIESEFY